MTEEVRVTDRPELGRYELTFDGELAGVVSYHDRSGTRIFDHTEVVPAFEGRGIGSRIGAAALEDALEEGWSVAIRCPFLRGYVERHPEIGARIAARNRTGSARG